MPHQPIFEQVEGPVLVSACLLGIRCRYDGRSRTRRWILKLPHIIPVPVCPEQLGGLPTPRPAAHLVGGDGRAVARGRATVSTASGEDVTRCFLSGAGYACKIARILGVRYAILKEGSPSCGTHRVWVRNESQEGLGVTAAMLLRLGICLMNEDGLMI
ncbi:MAG: DUF523 domain-containing protein [Syntrophaceae bacterium]|nr:DUF523 domain-containing protein [Deltaproteobacteria bacterium]